MTELPTLTDDIQLRLETINNQTYIIMEDVNFLKQYIFKKRNVAARCPTLIGKADQGAQRRFAALGSGNGRQIPKGSGLRRWVVKTIDSVCNFLF